MPTPLDVIGVEFLVDEIDHTYMHGTIMDYLTGEPNEGKELDVWHTAPNGLYGQRDEHQVGS